MSVGTPETGEQVDSDIKDPTELMRLAILHAVKYSVSDLVVNIEGDNVVLQGNCDSWTTKKTVQDITIRRLCGRQLINEMIVSPR